MMLKTETKVYYNQSREITTTPPPQGPGHTQSPVQRVLGLKRLKSLAQRSSLSTAEA